MEWFSLIQSLQQFFIIVVIKYAFFVYPSENNYKFPIDPITSCLVVFFDSTSMEFVFMMKGDVEEPLRIANKMHVLLGEVYFT